MLELNDPVLVIKGLSEQLEEIYAAELICRCLRYYDSARWYSDKRTWKHRELEKLVKETNYHGRTSAHVIV